MSSSGGDQDIGCVGAIVMVGFCLWFSSYAVSCAHPSPEDIQAAKAAIQSNVPLTYTFGTFVIETIGVIMAASIVCGVGSGCTFITSYTKNVTTGEYSYTSTMIPTEPDTSPEAGCVAAGAWLILILLYLVARLTSWLDGSTTITDFWLSVQHFNANSAAAADIAKQAATQTINAVQFLMSF